MNATASAKVQSEISIPEVMGKGARGRFELGSGRSSCNVSLLQSPIRSNGWRTMARVALLDRWLLLKDARPRANVPVPYAHGATRSPSPMGTGFLRRINTGQS